MPDDVVDILKAACRHRMFSPGDKVLVAVSGGPDSVAMLHALHTRSAEFGITLHVAHLNHGIRGEESRIDQVFVQDLAHSFQIPITVKQVDVPALCKEMRTGIEETARLLRYKFLRDTATELGMSKIAVGHNADDRAESVLLNIIRGAGLEGLGSIRPVQGNLVRPLIDTYRSEIEAYIETNALPFRIDESNMDVAYTRNRIRHELIPLLAESYNPQIRDALVRVAEIAAAESDLMKDMTEQARQQIALDNTLDAGLLLELPLALQRRVIRREIERLKGDLKDITFEQVEGVLDALRCGCDFTTTLPPGTIYAELKGKAFRVRGEEHPPIIEPFEYTLQIPGTTQVAKVDLTLEASIIENPSAHKLPMSEAMIDADAIRGDLRVRNVRPGDRIVPFGMSGSKKLQDVFVDKKISRDGRAQAAVVVDDEKVIWVVGVVLSDLVKITDRTKKAIHLRAVSDR